MPTTDFRGVLTKTNVAGTNWWHSSGIPESSLPGYVAIPDAPANLAADPGSNSAALTWDAVTGADSIAVYYREGASGDFTLASAAIAGNATGYTLTGIDAETLYNWYATATNAAGTSEDSAIDDFTTDGVGEAERIFFENFESTLQSGSALINGAVVATTETSYSGTKCARVNLKAGASDPYVVTPSNASMYEYQGDLLLSGSAPEIFTIRWKFRIDDALWDGSGWSNSQAVTVNLKGGYFGEQGFTASRGFYIGLEGGPTGQLHFADNGGRGDGSWTTEPWVNENGRTHFYVSTQTEWGSDGEWHEFKIIIDNTHEDYRQVKIYIDEVLADNGDYAPDGVIRCPKTWLPETFSTCYTNADRVDESVDRTGVACGIQFDEIEIWEGALE